ncbi:Uma2 family endonuclease [Nocardia amikacinitolerans]|uniref:Uma2 family endonuclease n=1 Tax=Nocardia amikacinitolerans TaxID=756689 RepID=UPI0020A42448|nr:Uma2 family endonuclease [Nocardia amikacinitolerans]MCP2290384.1 Endonuclease, Uma2 family (restriction endonuclease fold) [Nocardia amikacinitolerans]MCP2299011.1 Endonuclease, Uma2 family (restriction endonuclease fold) [Nocardia amikacinitolerans]
MSVAHDHTFGPYTVYDLDALPDEGKGYELADGWLIPLSPSPRHDMAADILRDLFRSAARAAGASVYVQAPMDISTPAGIRKPDVGVLDRDAARAAHEQNARTFYGRDVLLAAEIVSRRSGSEQVDRVDKVIDYANTGIEHYWIIDLEPRPRVELYRLRESAYECVGTVYAGHRLDVEKPFPIAFDPAELLDVDQDW